MFKKIIVSLFLLSFLSINSFSQTTSTAPKFVFDAESKLISYNKVVELGTGTKDELFNKAIGWCNMFYKNPADVIREKKQEDGLIVCKARFKISNPPDKKGVVTDAGIVQYTLRLFFKDGRYKYDLTEFNWKQTSYFAAEKWLDKKSSSYVPEYDFYLQQLNENANQIIQDLEKGMKGSSAIKKNDW
jgi:hypothetical protein